MINELIQAEIEDGDHWWAAVSGLMPAFAGCKPRCKAQYLFPWLFLLNGFSALGGAQSIPLTGLGELILPLTEGLVVVFITSACLEDFDGNFVNYLREATEKTLDLLNDSFVGFQHVDLGTALYVPAGFTAMLVNIEKELCTAIKFPLVNKDTLAKEPYQPALQQTFKAIKSKQGTALWRDLLNFEDEVTKNLDQQTPAAYAPSES